MEDQQQSCPAVSVPVGDRAAPSARSAQLDAAPNVFAAAKAWTLPRLLLEDKPRRTIVGEVQSTGTPWTPEAVVRELGRRGLSSVKRHGYWMVQCPVPGHDDNDPSCKITAGHNVPLVVHCHGGCSQADVLKAIGPAPGWQSQPYSVQLPSDLDDCACIVHRRVLQGHELSPADKTSLRRWVHQDQRGRTARIVARPLAHAGAHSHHVLPRDLSAMSAAQRSRFIPAWAEALKTQNPLDGVGLVVLPARMGRVMKLVINDMVGLVNDRLAAGDKRAVPYASRWAAKRLGEDDRQIRKALERLSDHGIIVKVGELPTDDRWEDGTPLYALAVRAPCPFCARDAETGPGITGLDAEDAAPTGDRQAVVEPRAEQPQITAMAIAEVEDVADPGLAAAEGGADGDGVLGHDDCPFGRSDGHRQGYAAPRPPPDDWVILDGPVDEPDDEERDRLDRIFYESDDGLIPPEELDRIFFADPELAGWWAEFSGRSPDGVANLPAQGIDYAHGPAGLRQVQTSHR